MDKLGYRMVIEWSDADQVYIARVPAFPGLSAHGNTVEEAAREGFLAAEGILEVMAEDGDPLPPEDIASAHSA